MCGIALVLSGVHVVSSCFQFEHHHDEVNGRLSVLIDDLKVGIARRGPDHLGCKRLLLYSDGTTCIKNLIFDGDEEDEDKQKIRLDVGGDVKTVAELCFLGATLQLRGQNPVFQPLVSPSGSILIYNGEIFGGIHVGVDESDTESLLSALEMCCPCDCHAFDGDDVCSCCNNGSKSVPQVLSMIKGPWALAYWQNKSKTMWFGRDVLGRRSLLVHCPAPDDSRFILSSVLPTSSFRKECVSTSKTNSSNSEADPEFSEVGYWEELPCGIYNIRLQEQEENEVRVLKDELAVEVRKLQWKDPSLNKLIQWERNFLVPTVEDVKLCGDTLEDKKSNLLTLSNSNGVYEHESEIRAQREHQPYSILSLPENPMQSESGYVNWASQVLCALRESVIQRASVERIFEKNRDEVRDEKVAPIAILFSGGLDSSILAALLDQCVNSKCTIDLLNVSFDGQLAPDRISARAGLKELQRISPHRRWRLVEIDAALSNLRCETEHVKSLIYPSKTYMDLNIGTALWLAACGDGWVDGELCDMQQGCRYKYKSTSRVLLVGSGADEQCAGYSRHRTKFRLGGWIALHNEMRLDVQRIWKRNMGRDDRCISDHGKEARFPFLDENVVETLLEIPLWEIAKLDEPVGKGDKKVLREVAMLLGLQEAALQPKRAIQFGSRIARESNQKNFGSNRAANQAAAGSVVIRKHN